MSSELDNSDIKLSPDAITESIFEIRFNSSELPELIVGRLIDYELWKGYSKTQLPIAQIPTPIRLGDIKLKYQPTIDLQNNENNISIKIGPNVISCHILGNYIGWKEKFFPLIVEQTTALSNVGGIEVYRLGLRYINTFTQSKHNIVNLNDFEFSIKVGGNNIVENFNLNFIESKDENHNVIVRLATSEFVEGNKPEDIRLFIDIDVSKVFESGCEDLLGWVEDAHSKEKDAFFKLLPNDLIEKLSEG